MPRKRRVGRPRKRRVVRRRVHRKRGAGFFDFLGKIHNFIKSNKIISRVASLIPHPVARTVGTAAGALGYGRRRRRVARRRRGGRFMPAIPNSQLYSVASLYGGGRRRLHRKY